jgi:hypothetical protein
MVRNTIFLISLLLVLTLAFAPYAPVASELESSGNPHPRKDNFSKWPDFGEGEDWRYFIIDGNGGNISVNGPTTFDNSAAEVTSNKELRFFQVYDPDFDAEYPGQYNNVFMIGFQGYIPNTQRDIIWNFDMKIESGLYGTTGMVIERKDTFAPDGNFALPFDFFGVIYAGEENFNSGLSCASVVNWTPISRDPINGVDPFQWNAYEIRFHLVDSETVLASIAVNDTQVCQTTIANYGETEIQIWLDNYKFTLDPSSPQGYTIGFNNEETPQGILFDNIAAKAMPAQ